MTKLSATPQTLAKLISAAVIGDAIDLAPGDYGDIRIASKKGLEFTFQPGASLRSMVLKQSSDLLFSGLAIKFMPVAATVTWSAAVLISECDHITINGGEIIGGPAVSGVAETAPVRDNSGNVIGRPTGKAIDITKSQDIEVTGLKIRAFDRGIGMSGAKRITVQQNDIRDLRRTAISGAGIQDVSILANVMEAPDPWRWGETPAGDHGDFIAFWTDRAALAEPMSGLVIEGNAMIQGKGVAILGMWLQDNASPKLGIIAPKIRNNVILNGNTQGITLRDVTDAEVSDNLLLQTSGGPKNAPGVLFTAGTVGAASSRNTLGSVNDMTTENKNTSSGDVIHKPADFAAHLSLGQKLLERGGAQGASAYEFAVKTLFPKEEPKPPPGPRVIEVSVKPGETVTVVIKGDPT